MLQLGYRIEKISRIIHIRKESWKGRDGALRERNRVYSATGANGFPFVELLHASAAFKKGFVAVELGLGFRCGFTAFESSKGVANGSTRGALLTLFVEDLAENTDFLSKSGCKGRPRPGEKL
jgi:hypothetical protein